MTLPKPNLPTFELMTNQGNLLKFRQQTMSDEKALLIAATDEDDKEKSSVDQVRNLLDSCLINFSTDDLYTSEIEELFLKLRQVSVSNTIDLVYERESCTKDDCPKNIRTSSNLDLYYMSCDFEEEVQKLGLEKKKDGYVVMITDTEGVILRPPMGLKVSEETTYDCIVQVFSGEEYYDRDSFTKEELEEFLSSIPSAALIPIKKFFRCVPTVCLDVDVKCPACERKIVKTIEGIQGFFG